MPPPSKRPERKVAVPLCTIPPARLAQPVVVPRSRARMALPADVEMTGAGWGALLGRGDGHWLMVVGPSRLMSVRGWTARRPRARSPWGWEWENPLGAVLPHPRRGWLSPPQLRERINMLKLLRKSKLGRPMASVAFPT